MILSDNGRISGTTSNALTVANVLPTDAGDYRLIVTNSSGAATSAVATLTITLPEFVVIPDAALESSVRAALNKPTGPLTPADLGTLTGLSACGQSISNLAGLEWATNLVSLNVSFNAISNVTGVEGLSRLIQLGLDGNRINDLSPLAGLTNLNSLNLGGNFITNVSALSGLTNLTALSLHRNPLGSLNPLTNLAGLKSLVLFSAGIADSSDRKSVV